jgi:hypothetical protein
MVISNKEAMVFGTAKSSRSPILDGKESRSRSVKVISSTKIGIMT